MDYTQSGRIGVAAGIGLLVVMPILYFTSDGPRTGNTAAVDIALEEAAASTTQPVVPQPPQPVTYIEVLDGCAEHFQGACVNVRSGPGTEYPAVATLRTGVVLRVEKVVHAEDRDWYKIMFDEWVRYPERLSKDLYIAADIVHPFEELPPQKLVSGTVVQTNKRILVDRSDQMLYAYDGDRLFMEEKISTGLDDTPTPRGNFKIFSKTPSRYMQGPVPGITTEDDVYDLPGVPWTMYFTEQGGAIHGAYWHDEFGFQHSHGCVNLPPQKAKELYEWAELGTPVTVRD